MLADEPTGNIDTETGAEIMRLLAAANDRGNTVLLVTHSREIAGYADRIVHIRDGRIESIEELGIDEGSDATNPAGEGA